MTKRSPLIMVTILGVLLFSVVLASTLFSDVEYSAPIVLQFAVMDSAGKAVENVDISVNCTLADKTYITGPEISYNNGMYSVEFRCRPSAPGYYTCVPKKEPEAVEVLLNKGGFRKTRRVFSSEELVEYFSFESTDGIKYYDLPEIPIEEEES